MKSYLAVLVLSLSFAGNALMASAPIPISVLKFTEKAAVSENSEDGCYSWYYFGADRLGSAFQERLISELVKDKRFLVLERETIKEVHDNEIELINSHKEAPIEKGHFKKAQYTLVGVVKAFDWCVGGESGRVNVGSLLGIGDLDVGAKRNKAQVTVEIRVIDTKTGKVLQSVSGTGERTSYKLGFGGTIKNVDLGSKAFRNSSLGEAIDEAISEAATKIKKALSEKT